MKKVVALIAVVATLNELALARTQTSRTTSTPDAVIIRSDEFATIQQVIDDRAARGYRVSSVSYKSSFKNLYSTGRLVLNFVADEPSSKYEYRALTTELRAAALEKDLNEAGAKGFRLRHTPIPLELGLVRPKDMFVVIMERPKDTTARYTYRVLANRRWPSGVREALAAGFVKSCSTQFGVVTYTVMEKPVG
jgi:hypothetical protein